MLIAALTAVPIVVLLYFYPALPERIPVFLNFRGGVEVWAAKSWAAVLRVPAMAIDLQLICLLMKYGTVRSQKTKPESRLTGLGATNTEEYLQFQNRATFLTARLWDWLRCLVAFKMAAASLEVVFMNLERLRFLWTPAWAITWIAAILSIVAAVYYGYRLLMVRREMKAALASADVKAPESADIEKRIDKAHLLGGFLYYNPNDPAPFVDKYAFNFVNKWVYVLLACIVAYPLLVFWPL